MDHLWIDREQQNEPSLIPYHDPGELKYFYDEADTWLDTWGRYTGGPTVIMVQEGLFFRTIARWCCIMGMPYERNDYIRNEAALSLIMLENRCQEYLDVRYSQWWNNNDKLVEYISTLKEPRHGPSVSKHYDRQQHGLMLDEILGSSQEQASAIEALRRSNHDLRLHLKGPANVPDAELLACSLVDELIEACAKAAVIYIRPSVSPFTERQDFWITSAQNAGICPRRLAALRSPSHAVVATTMRIRGNHHDCKADKCLAPSPTLPQHYECTDCDLISLSREGARTMLDAIENRGFGLLRFDQEHSEHLEVVEAEQYIAISHVWTHGLGNPDANALPRCQLRRLRDIVGSNPFWLDTLCVPLGPNKMRALHKMADIYRKSRVIVLDDHLRQVYGDMRLKQIALALCDWVTRLWTLQEGLLPKEVLVAFGDGLVPLPELLSHPRSILWSSTALYLNSLLDGSEPSDIFYKFATRTTTNLEDEGVCMSILLGVDIAADLPGAVQQLKAVDQNLAFVTGDRCDRPGLRWCPRSLLEQNNSIFNVPQQRLLSTRGLHMKKPMLHLGTLMYGTSVWNIGDLYVVVPRPDSTNRPVPRLINGAVIIFSNTVEHLEECGIAFCILASSSGSQGHFEANAVIALRNHYDADLPSRSTDVHTEIKSWYLCERELWVD